MDVFRALVESVSIEIERSFEDHEWPTDALGNRDPSQHRVGAETRDELAQLGSNPYAVSKVAKKLGVVSAEHRTW
eukprot:10501142-Alexandrium_andersonii.AAC.1